MSRFILHFDYITIEILLREGMSKEKLVAKIKELLKIDADLDFLLDLKKKEIETLIACIRDRVG